MCSDCCFRARSVQAHPPPLPQAGGEFQRFPSPSRLREGLGVGKCHPFAPAIYRETVFAITLKGALPPSTTAVLKALRS